MEKSENKVKTPSYNNDYLLQIEKRLNEIIDYIQKNLEKNDNNIELDLERKEGKKLGKKRKNSIKLSENEVKNEKNFKEYKEKDDMKIIILKNKKLKLKLKEFKKLSNKIVKKIK